jgi:hypothetical protein
MAIDNDFDSKSIEVLEKWYRNRIYMVEIRQKDNMTDYQIRTHGTPTVGNKAMDQFIMNEPMAKYVTIPEMMEYYQNGVRLAVVKERDCSEIYKLANGLLERWANTVRSGVNIRAVPMEEVLALDEFLKVMFPLAARTMKVENPFNFMQTYITKRQDQVQEEKVVRRHDSVQEEMVGLVYGGYTPVKKDDNFLNF